MTDDDYDYILDEIECRGKLSLKVMWVALMTRNSADVNNHSTLFYVVFYYIIIKYQYINKICFFIFVSFYICA